MDTPTTAVDLLLATKFFIPVASQPLVARARLTALLNGGLQRRLTLVCAPAGFGKSTLLAEWVRSLPPPPDGPFVAWLSLDEDDDSPARFGEYFITALSRAFPGVGSQALEYVHTPKGPAIHTMETVLINSLAQSEAEYLVVLDDYHHVTDPAIHSALAYLLDHLPPNVHVAVSSRVEPPLPLPRLRARGWLLELRTDDLRCTVEEGIRFLKVTAGVDLPDHESRQVIQQTEGWLVGLQLLGHSLRGEPDPGRILEELGGTQDYILDYLTEEVLQGQPEEVRAFLLQTSILNELSPSLCDAVMCYEPGDHQSGTGQGSQTMLQYLEQANLFLAPLDHQRRWYRYHHLFAEALRYQLNRRYERSLPGAGQGGNDANDLAKGASPVLQLHRRASDWYREHGRNRRAVEHALLAREWNPALDLIAVVLAQDGILPWHTSLSKPEQTPDVRVALAQLGVVPPQILTLLRWFERLPTEVLSAHPAFCFTYALMLFAAGLNQQVTAWLDAAEAALRYGEAQKEPLPETAQKVSGRENEIVLIWINLLRAFNISVLEEDGERVLALCDEVMVHLTPKDHLELSVVGNLGYSAYLLLGNAVEAARSALRTYEQAQHIRPTFLQIIGLADLGTMLQLQGKLHEAEATFQQAIALGSAQNPPSFVVAGIPYVRRADLLREWNRLDEALEVLHKGRNLASETWFPPLHLDSVGAVLARLHLSRGELDDALAALERADLIPELSADERELRAVTGMHPAGATRATPDNARIQGRYMHPWCTDAERVKIWLARGEVDRAARWAEQLERQRQADFLAYGRPYPAPYRRDCEDVARARIALARSRPNEALKLLEPVAVRAREGGRLSQLIEIKLLQALAHSTRGGQTGDANALTVLAEAVLLGETEGFIRSFVDEGPPIAALLSQLRARQRRAPTPALDAGAMSYIDSLLVAFEGNGQSTVAYGHQAAPVHAGAQRAGGYLEQGEFLVEPLSPRELEVLGLVAEGASNAEIAEHLFIALNTVKRHISNIFEKLAVSNRTQAVAQARSLGLLDEQG